MHMFVCVCVCVRVCVCMCVHVRVRVRVHVRMHVLCMHLIAKASAVPGHCTGCEILHRQQQKRARSLTSIATTAGTYLALV